MVHPPLPDNVRPIGPPRVLVIGGGFGGLNVAKALGGEAVEVRLLDRQNHHLFQPLLYQVALAGLSAPDIAVPIRSVLRDHRNVAVALCEVTAVDLIARQVTTSDGRVARYDYLVLAAGARTNYYGHDDWAAIAPGLKSLDDALEIRRRVLSALEAAEQEEDSVRRRELLTFVVVGGGATGVELAGAIADLSRDILTGDFRLATHAQTRVVLVEMADRILAPFDPKLSEKATDQLRELRVEIRTAVRVTKIDQAGLHLGDELIACATVLWGAGVAPSPLARALGTPLDRAGRVLVEADCSIPGHPEAFVIGDLASFTPPGTTQPLPGISPVAIQQGRLVAANILRTMRGEPRQPFRYVDKGIMATIGRARAVAQFGRLRLSGVVAWLLWALVHLVYLVGFRNRIVVFLNWIWSYLMSRYGARVILGIRATSPTSK